MSMRITEITQPALKASAQTIGSDTHEPTPLAQPTPPVPQEPVYANKELKSAIQFLAGQLPNGKFTREGAGGSKQIPSIRAKGISPADLKTAMGKWGATATSTDTKQVSASSSFPAYSFEKDGILYTVVIGMKGAKAGDETSIGIGRKELTPAGLGIHGRVFNKKELVSATINAVTSKFGERDPILANILIALVNSAAGGGKAVLPAEGMAHISDYLGTVSQDFGEILAPILIMKPNDKAELPTGNNPLVDVKLQGMNISVKALTGSGTSFRSISDLMDKYEASIGQDAGKQEKFKILKQFHPGTGGNNKDKIIRSVATATIPEYQKLLSTLNVSKLTSFSDLEKAVGATKNTDYATFLKTFYPMMNAGNWGKPVGLPADGAYYLGLTDKVKKEKSAGKPSFVANPVKAGADIITYALGVGLLNYIKQGADSLEYKDMMTDIVNKADVVIGHISINRDGTLLLKTRSFSDLKFDFQYHASSHIPGNNLPGFIAILD